MCLRVRMCVRVRFSFTFFFVNVPPAAASNLSTCAKTSESAAALSTTEIAISEQFACNFLFSVCRQMEE